jgi:hypothetical protein
MRPKPDGLHLFDGGAIGRRELAEERLGEPREFGPFFSNSSWTDAGPWRHCSRAAGAGDPLRPVSEPSLIF